MQKQNKHTYGGYMKLSNLIGKQVFCVYDANILGTIHDVAFDDKYTKILGIYFFDQEENEYFLKSKNIYAINDFVTIKNTSLLSQEIILDKPLSPLGKLIIDTIGTNYGNISDIEFDDKFKVTNFETNLNKSVEPKNLIFISKNFVFGNNVKISSFRPKTAHSNNVLSNLTVTMMKVQEPTIDTKKLMPTKITVNSDVLIGKRLSKDIIGKNNELILKQNQVLTSKLVLLAKQHDKLNELFYSVY